MEQHKLKETTKRFRHLQLTSSSGQFVMQFDYSLTKHVLNIVLLFCWVKYLLKLWHMVVYLRLI